MKYAYDGSKPDYSYDAGLALQCYETFASKGHCEHCHEYGLFKITDEEGKEIHVCCEVLQSLGFKPNI